VTRERALDLAFLGAVLATLLALAAPRDAGLGSLELLRAAQTVVLLAASALAMRAAWMFEAGNPARTAWALLSLGLAALVMGEAIEVLYTMVWAIEAPVPSPADAFFLLAYPLLGLAFVLVRRAYRASGYPVGSGQGAFVWTTVVALTLLGGLVLAPLTRAEAPLAERAVTAAYVVLDLLVLVPLLLLLRMTWRFRGGGLYKVWAGVILGFLLTLAGDVFFAYLKGRAGEVAGLGGEQLGVVSDVLFLVSYLAISRGILYQIDILDA
jgi:hypothetical protein